MAGPDTRLYGMADPSNHQAAADNGMRGEGAADASGPAYRHEVHPPGQSAIVVEEVSGVSFAEAQRVKPAERPEPEPEPESGSALAWILVAGVLGYAAGRLRRSPRIVEPAPIAPAALTLVPGETGGFSQVRDAGPQAMRDPQPHWSAIDEASDESFPASDPPAMSIPGR
jgi:hypothetical protein